MELQRLDAAVRTAAEVRRPYSHYPTPNRRYSYPYADYSYPNSHYPTPNRRYLYPYSDYSYR